jgi:rhamnulokinase
VRVCLESLAMTYRQTLRRIEECTGRKAEVIHIVGGGTQNRTSASGRPMPPACTVVCGPIEATAAGNIAVQAVATGVLKDIWERPPAHPPVVRAGHLQAGRDDQWDRAYKRFEQLRV